MHIYMEMMHKLDLNVKIWHEDFLILHWKGKELKDGLAATYIHAKTP